MIIGITGIIGAGKSTIAEIFRRRHKALVIDVDRIGHALLSSEPLAMEKVIKAFGTNKRSELAKIVFNNQDKLKLLNKITHPLIRRRVKELIKNNRKELIIIDAALLFPIGLHRFCNHIIFVDAPLEKINNNLLKKGLSNKEIQLRINANKAVFRLKNRCDYLIENQGSKRDLIKEVQRIVNNLKN